MDFSGGAFYKVELIKNYFNYDAATRRHDLSLVKSIDKITFDDLVMPISITSKFKDISGVAVMCGWGNTFTNPDAYRKVLQYIFVTMIRNVDCVNPHAAGGAVKKNILCTWSHNGQGIQCGGDSGGPLIHNQKLVGISSWGSCQQGDFDVFTRVSEYYYWIKASIAH